MSLVIIRFSLVRCLAALLAIGAVLLSAGCGTMKEIDETVGWPPDRLYSEARKDLDSRNWAAAIKLLEKLESRYPFGRWAEQAQLQIAYAHFRNNERVLAVAALDRFIKLHPNHPTLDYAFYMKGVINFNEQEGLFAALGGQNLAERDLQAARDAFDAFRTLIARFPQSRYVDDARDRMAYLVDAMATGELAVARYYFRRGAYVAAANRAQGVIRQFPDARATQDALFILAESYDKLGMPELRDDTRRVIDKNFSAGDAARSLQSDRKWYQIWR
jgi:outer membrane protein assembly factor BamD